MFSALKNRLAKFIVKRKYVGKNPPQISFNNFITNSVYYFVIMPEDSHDFENCLSILKFFDTNKKNVTVFIPEKNKNLVPGSAKFKFVTYNESDLTKLGIPNHVFVKRLRKKDFDLVIDLNLNDNILASAVTNIVSSNFRVGFVKTDSDKYYNLQFNKEQNNSEISYKNLLNSLGMF